MPTFILVTKGWPMLGKGDAPRGFFFVSNRAVDFGAFTILRNFFAEYPPNSPHSPRCSPILRSSVFIRARGSSAFSATHFSRANQTSVLSSIEPKIFADYPHSPLHFPPLQPARISARIFREKSCGSSAKESRRIANAPKSTALLRRFKRNG